MYRIRVYFHPILDDPSNPDERVVVIGNSLPQSYPDHQGVTFCVTLLPDGYLDMNALEVDEGVTLRVPTKHLAPEPPVEAHWVNAAEGIWLVLGGRDVSPVMSAWLKPFLTDFVTDIARFFGRMLVWSDDI